MQLDFISDINKSNFSNFNYHRMDRIMVQLLWLHFLLAVIWVWFIEAFEPALRLPGPISWRLVEKPEAWTITAIAFGIAVVPTVLLGRLKNHYIYRLLITLAFFAYSYLYIVITGGAIEAHFHLFVSFLLLSMYYDWRLQWFGVLLTGIHHLVLNFIKPDWLFYYGENNSAVAAHVIYVIFTVAFTTWICENGRRTVNAAAEANKKLETELRSKIPALNK